MVSLRLAVLLLALTGSAAIAPRTPKTHGWIIEESYDLDAEWTKFKEHFVKTYATPEEEARRRAVFGISLIRATKGNLKNVAAGGKPVFGVTKFSDLTLTEMEAFKGRKGMGAPLNTERVTKPSPEAYSTTSIDWTALGYTTPVKNQGQCGSCWAFSATEQIESQYMIAGEAPWPLSVQMIASCTSSAYGCGGGDTTLAFDQLMTGETKSGMTIGGVASAAMIPYVQSMTEACNGRRCTEKCNANGVGNVTEMIPYESLTGPYVGVTGYSYATSPCTGKCASQDLDTLNANIAETAPAAICVNAETWGDYVSGVLTTSACGGYAYKNLDHCVQLTGFNLDADEPYYIVRNSWATNWGNDGHIYLSASDNTCGVADEAIFVDVTF